MTRLKRRSLDFFIETIIFITFVFILLGHSSLLSDTSKLYSTSIAHRLQTDAFLKGHLSLSPLPFGYLVDFNWNGHGLQQAWGLGVPLLRLPFEWMAVRLGVDPFPDRLVVLFYLALTIVVLNMSFRSLLTVSGLLPDGMIALLLRWYLIAWIFYAPAMGVLIQQHINDVYHETIFYGCLYTYFLLALFWMYMTKLNARIFIILCLASGLGWLIRPTMIGYGLTTVVLACAGVYQNKRNFRLMSIGVLCFCAGVMAGLWCNYLRFGSMLDFGYSEDFCAFPVLNYSMRFDYPFHHEPVLNAAKELIGALFFNNPWESHTVRFRWGFAGYHCPFNSTYLMIIGAGIILYFTHFLSRSFKTLRAVYFSLVWGIICSGFLLGFYLRALFINSRYLSDFAPAFNSLFIALIVLSLSRLTFYFKDKRAVIVFFLALCLLFYAANGSFFKFDGQSFKSFYQTQVTDKKGIKKLVADFNQNTLLRPALPETSYCGHSYPDSGLVYQYQGWNIHSDCLVNALTSAILPMKRCVTLNYTVFGHIPGVQVKRDLIFLKLVDTQMTKLNNAGIPQVATNQLFCSDGPMTNPVALYSIGWISPDELNTFRNDTLPVKLNWISVHEK